MLIMFAESLLICYSNLIYKENKPYILHNYLDNFLELNTLMCEVYIVPQARGVKARGF